MSLSRGDFMKLFGVSVASLLLARCRPLDPVARTPRQRLRKLWLQFDDLASGTSSGRNDENELGSRFISDHRTALDELVAAGELVPPVADLVQEAYAAAVYHVWRSNAPITCYEPVFIDYAPTSAQVLVEQSAVLEQLASNSSIDPNTLAAARAALEHDLAFYALSDVETQELYQRLVEQSAQDHGLFPSFEQVELDLTPEAREAARFIVEMISRP